MTMFIHLNSDGTIAKVLHDRVIRRSNVNKIYVFAPFAPGSTVLIHFQKPNGELITGPMIFKEFNLANQINTWEYSLMNRTITDIAGKVLISLEIRAITEGGVEITATPNTHMWVEESIGELPEIEEVDEFLNLANLAMERVIALEEEFEETTADFRELQETVASLSELSDIVDELTDTKADIEDLVADNISFDGSGTNFLAGETNVEGAIKELDTRVKNELDSVKNGITIEEKAIKPFQTSFLELGKNIFNKDTVIDGYRVVTRHGNLVEAPGYTASQFIEVKPNTEYVWNLNTTNDTICFYDENKTYIPSSGVYGVTSFTTPANCYFIRVSFLTERFGVKQKTIAQIELGDTPTAYEPYFGYKIDGTKLNTNSVNVSSLDNELKQILIKSNEIYGFNFDFNGSLLRSPVMPSWKYNENRFEIRRNSVAYDDNGNEIGPNLPVYRNVDFRRKGITQMEATTNLLTEANSISFSTPETISLNPGTYTLSFNKGNGSISIIGYPDVTLNNPLTFTLSETANILLTPNGVVEMAQLEMKPYATYWQKGGIPRAGSSTRIFLDEPINTEFGIGVRMQMNQDSTVIPTGSDENWRILHIYKDADNFIEVNLRPRFQYLVFTYRVNGVTTQIINYNVTYKKDEPFEVYIHVIPNNSMFIYYTKNGVLHQKFEKADSIAIPPNFTQVALAHRLILPTQDSNINNSIITNFKLERGLNCNPQRYFKEVLL